MDRIVKGLIVDDKLDYCESLCGAARNRNINLIYSLDWESGFIKLQEQKDIEFVILDGKGKIEEDQAVESEKFALRAIRDIDRFSKDSYRYLPFCVNTGYMDNFELFEDEVKIFEKADANREPMFDYLLAEVSKSGYHKARHLFPETFEIFDLNILEQKHQHLLIDFIKCLGDKDYRKKNVPVLRDLFEAVLKSLNNPLPVIPDALFKDDGSPNLAHCVRFLEGRDTTAADGSTHLFNKSLPVGIQTILRKLKEDTSEYSHLNDNEIIKYEFLSNAYSMLELLVYIPKFAQENYSNYY